MDERLMSVGVNDNIKKVQHQIDLAETALIEGHEIGGDELPTVEISEEVDEEGNVLGKPKLSPTSVTLPPEIVADQLWQSRCFEKKVARSARST